MVKLSVILPVHNEASIIEGVLKEIIVTLRRTAKSFECILVENGSTDSTLVVLNRLSKKYSNVSVLVAPKGYGSAVLTGLSKAKGTYVCYMPSDGQIDLSVFPKLWKEMQSDRWDMVKIRRSTRESWDRTVVSMVLSHAVSLLFGLPRIDVNGSPRIFRRKDLKKLGLQSKDSFIDTEFAVIANRLLWKIKEIPMKTLPRSGGVSTRSWRTYWEFIRNIISYRMHR